MKHAGAHDSLLGVTIGNYQIKVKLGAGGMGSVYMAEHPLIGKQVALKVLHPELSANEHMVTRFFYEARAVNDIKHPNIVDIIDFGRMPRQGRTVVYLLMELLEGVSLADLLRRETTLPWKRAFAIAWQIADALGASHAVGIIHRDLKPDNIMLLQRGHRRDFVKVLDFGIAKLTGAPDGSHHTRTGVILGTFGYMSPEQCEGRGDVDHRTDIYSLGILLYKMLTGREPFQGECYGDVLVQQLTQAPVRPSTLHDGIPPYVEAVVMKALARQRDARYPNMDELMKALADPAGYVEGHSDLGGFTDETIPRGAVVQPPSVLTDGPTLPFAAVAVTPMAEQAQGSASGQSQQTTTMRSGAGLVAAEALPSASKVPVVIGLMLVLVLVMMGSGILVARQGLGRHASTATELPEDEAAATSGTHVDDTRVENAGSNVILGAQPSAGGAGDTIALDHRTTTVTPGPDSVDGAAYGQVPSEPEQVAITIETKPAGADVFVGRAAKPRGKTPLTIELLKSSEQVTLTLKRSGYKDLVRQIVPSRPDRFAWNLSRARLEQHSPAPDDSTELRKGVDEKLTLGPDL